MKHRFYLPGVALCLALFTAGCETDNLSARIHEKSAVYASLKPWQKKNIDKGIIAMSFTTDMVYMAIGNPDSKRPAGTGELWTYRHYYPTVGADQVKYSFSTESHFANSGNLAPGMPGSTAKAGVRPSIFQTGEPQGGSMEPQDLVSYTLWVTFENGVVTKMNIERNP